MSHSNINQEAETKLKLMALQVHNGIPKLEESNMNITNNTPQLEMSTNTLIADLSSEVDSAKEIRALLERLNRSLFGHPESEHIKDGSKVNVEEMASGFFPKVIDLLRILRGTHADIKALLEQMLAICQK